ncbi:hypothetical protein F3087_45025 [Nocardia colli]|uniref:Lipoprotein n=1 Tax=Nocardia colli TaxID=2545717 RepID=A0A5N0DN44_9NOCA|nr:hypothetical protein [Nocardia colli]KAA8877339.1 hypothetical protein F3087_45025 [Nocardia colli]
MSRNIRNLVICLSVVIVGTGVCACDPDKQPSKPDPAFSNVWSAEPGIDLFSRGTELVRAAHESGWLVNRAGIDNAYIGYREALAPPDNDHDMDVLFTEQKTFQGADSVLQAGKETDYSRVTALSANGKTVTATVCRYVVPEKGVNSGNLNDFASTMSVVDLRLENTGSEPGKTGVADNDPGQHDPAAHRVPSWNVFGTWKITKIKRNLDADPEGCRSWFQQQIPGLIAEPGSKTLKFPPTLQIPPQPVAVQYPEWISPSQ